jgi:hypothetical protein
VIGLGVKFDAADTVELRAEFERYKNVGDDDKTGESDVDVLSVGAVMKF